MPAESTAFTERTEVRLYELHRRKPEQRHQTGNNRLFKIHQHYHYSQFMLLCFLMLTKKRITFKYLEKYK